MPDRPGRPERRQMHNRPMLSNFASIGSDMSEDRRIQSLRVNCSSGNRRHTGVRPSTGRGRGRGRTRTVASATSSVGTSFSILGSENGACTFSLPQSLSVSVSMPSPSPLSASMPCLQGLPGLPGLDSPTATGNSGFAAAITQVPMFDQEDEEEQQQATAQTLTDATRDTPPILRTRALTRARSCGSFSTDSPSDGAGVARNRRPVLTFSSPSPGGSETGDTGLLRSTPQYLRSSSDSPRCGGLSPFAGLSLESD
jgi:hypothetical protein